MPHNSCQWRCGSVSIEIQVMFPIHSIEGGSNFTVMVTLWSLKSTCFFLNYFLKLQDQFSCNTWTTKFADYGIKGRYYHRWFSLICILLSHQYKLEFLMKQETKVIRTCTFSFAWFVMFWMRAKAQKWGKYLAGISLNNITSFFNFKRSTGLCFLCFFLISPIKGDSIKDRKSDFLWD